MKFICKAPAKLILTGEHAVLNGVPALSLAINLATNCQINFSSKKTAFFEIELVNYQQKISLPFLLWNSMAIEIESRYQQYLNKSLPIQSVLKQPVDLIICCLYHFNTKYAIKNGYWQICISSHSLQSRGLGSSASVIIGVIYSLYQTHNIEINQQEILQLATIIENRQHGESSGVDIATVLFGGLIKYQPQQPIKSLISEKFSAWLIDTGFSQASTGQVVSYVKHHFPSNNSIWQDFKQVSEKIELAWLQQNTKQLKKLIQKNQDLLEVIGVVPKKVQQFLKLLSSTSACVGKICGSGTIIGDSVGIILCIGEPPKDLCEQYGYHLIPIKINTRGVYCEMVD